MRKYILASAAAASALALSGCGSSGIFDRNRPDEFAVSRAAPLVVPPDFALTPPQPGAPRPQGESTQDQVLEALFGGPAPRSATQQAVTSNAGSADTGIRSSVGDPDTNTVNKGSVTRDIIAAPEGDGQNAQAATPGN
ncbi:DUF3035 domain-containing protein [Sphingorhabdus arenilitoris]|uniref:DUF3035 domain-containing protein n=1 Tax=Sphingorhabdus arenilitoris TaxID=1490041 RepID=A0ABV8RCJ8_9SPHN